MFGMLGGVGITLTHYGSAVTPIYFNAGYVPQGTWWRIGFIISLVNFSVMFGIGTLWMKAIGYV
jgi:DASS family divalent anion:Na+ symporter